MKINWTLAGIALVLVIPTILTALKEEYNGGPARYPIHTSWAGDQTLKSKPATTPDTATTSKPATTPDAAPTSETWFVAPTLNKAAGWCTHVWYRAPSGQQRCKYCGKYLATVAAEDKAAVGFFKRNIVKDLKVQLDRRYEVIGLHGRVYFRTTDGDLMFMMYVNLGDNVYSWRSPETLSNDVSPAQYDADCEAAREIRELEKVAK